MLIKRVTEITQRFQTAYYAFLWTFLILLLDLNQGLNHWFKSNDLNQSTLKAKLSGASIEIFVRKLLQRTKFIPVEFKGKIRPLPELPYWKASEFRLFMLYSGVCILNSNDILPNEKFLHFLKFSVAMRMLLSSQTDDSDMAECESMLKQFVKEAAKL